jgi:hypothetical protein
MMIVSAETFTAIVNSLRSDQRSVDERRGKPRVGLSGKALVQEKDGQLTAVVVRDLSQSGMGMVRHQPLEIGSQFTLCFANKGSDPVKGILCEVVRCQRVTEALYTVGVKFIRHVEIKPRKSDEPAGRTLDDMLREMRARSGMTGPPPLVSRSL